MVNVENAAAKRAQFGGLERSGLRETNQQAVTAAPAPHRQTRPAAMVLSMVLALAGALPLHAAAPDVRLALRSAIDDLAATYGARYPRAGEYRSRLDALAADDTAGSTPCGGRFC